MSTTATTTTAVDSIAKIHKLNALDDFSPWKSDIETYFIWIGCLGIVDGTDVEPGRSDLDREDREATVEEVAERMRATRAGSVIPPADLDGASKVAWKAWKERENKAVAALRGTVSGGLLVDIRKMESAKEMWDFLIATHPMTTPENQAAVRRAMERLMLRDLSPAGMTKHLTEFNMLIQKADDAGMDISTADRAQRFCDTLPIELIHIVTTYNLLSPTIPLRERWTRLLALYNGDMARRDNVRSAESTYMLDGHTGKRGGKGGKRGNGDGVKKSGGDEGSKKGEKEGDSGESECFHCHKLGHWKKDCQVLRDEQLRKRQGGDKRESAHLTWGSQDDAVYDFIGSVGAPEVRVAKHEKRGNSPAQPKVRVSDQRWVVDSAARTSITPHRHLIFNRTKLDEPIEFEVAKKGGRMWGYEVGEMKVETDDGAKAVLSPVFWVPAAGRNLLSVYSAVKNDGWSLELGERGDRMTKGKESLSLARNGELWKVPTIRDRSNPTCEKGKRRVGGDVSEVKVVGAGEKLSARRVSFSPTEEYQSPNRAEGAGFRQSITSPYRPANVQSPIHPRTSILKSAHYVGVLSEMPAKDLAIQGHVSAVVGPIMAAGDMDFGKLEQEAWGSAYQPGETPVMSEGFGVKESREISARGAGEQENRVGGAAIRDVAPSAISETPSVPHTQAKSAYTLSIRGVGGTVSSGPLVHGSLRGVLSIGVRKVARRETRGMRFEAQEPSDVHCRSSFA